MARGDDDARRDFHATVREHLAGVLEAGETLTGVMAATQQKTFSGRMVALAVTDRRLLVQPLTRRAEPDGAPTSILPAEMASFDLRTAGGEWWNTEIPVTDAALTMRLRTTGGDKLTLHLMRGGDGLLGRLGGGADQESGVAALAAWVEACRPGGT